MIRRILITLICLILSGCISEQQKKRHHELQSWFTRDGRIKVLSTIGMIHDLVEKVGGKYVHGHVLIEGELDPHTYQLVKGDGEKFVFADMIFYNGLGLEHGPSLRETLAADSQAVALGNKIQEQNPELILNYNGQIDPHIWMDIGLWKRTVPFIVEALSDYDPDHADYYEENGKQLVEQLNQADKEVKEIVHSVPPEKRYLVTSHDAFNYFTKSYLATDEEINGGQWQVRFAAPEGLAPDSQLSTTDIQGIVEHLEKYQISVLFPECNVSQDSINKIVQASQEIGLDVHVVDICLYSDSMGAKGSEGDTYIKMVQYNAKQIAKHLNGDS